MFGGISVNSQRAFAKLDNLQKRQVPFALSVSINETAKEAMEDIKVEMDEVFDRPTRWTKNAFYIQRATKRRMAAVIQRKTAQRGRHYLEIQSKGGGRPQTGFEKLVGSRMKSARVGRTVTPAKGARLNASGNWSPAQRKKALGAVKGKGGAAGSSTGAAGRNDFFAPSAKSKLSPGIYQRMRRGQKIKKIAHFSDSVPQYKARLDIVKVTKARVQRSFRGNFQSALRKALATAR
jgi:hypothetical protein